MKYIITVLSLFFLVEFNVRSSNVNILDEGLNKAIKDIELSFKTGNTSLLSRYLNNSVSLSMPGTESKTLSKDQTIQLINDFFKKNPSKQFSIIHQSTAYDNSIYLIGDYKTQNKVYRVMLYIRKTDDTYLIYQLGIKAD